MTATILVVDDEPDLEALVLQKFSKQVREGAGAFVFAHDGVEALQSIENHQYVDMVPKRARGAAAEEGLAADKLAMSR